MGDFYFQFTLDYPNLFISRRSDATKIHFLTLQNMKIAAGLIPLLFLACYEILPLEAVVLPNFYPFGQGEGDQLLPANDDQSSGTVSILIPFPFFDKNHNSVFVSRSFLLYLNIYTVNKLASLK